MGTVVRRIEPAGEQASLASFDEFVARQPQESDYELIDGAIVMMTNPIEIHELIVVNVGTPLNMTLRPRGCRAYMGGIAVQSPRREPGTFKTRPDIVVRCGPPGRGNSVNDPIVVVEVLSPATMDDDRGRKLDFYKSLDSLRHIVLVYQDQMRIEHYAGDPEGWRLEALSRPEAELDLSAVGFRIRLAEVYDGVPDL